MNGLVCVILSSDLCVSLSIVMKFMMMIGMLCDVLNRLVNFMKCVFCSWCRIRFMCLCIDSFLWEILWCWMSFVCLSMLVYVVCRLFEFMLGKCGVMFCLMYILVCRKLWLSCGSWLSCCVVSFICLYFSSWCMSLVCGFLVFLLVLVFLIGSSICDLILISIVVISRYLVVSLRFDVWIWLM